MEARLYASVAQPRHWTALLGGFAAAALVLAAVGVFGMLSYTVRTRQREIGVRMATGARQRDILAQFLSEAIVVSAIGGVIGVLVGIGVGLLIRTFSDVDVVFSSEPMLLAFSCAAATGVVFGFAPARKAARLDPVVALSNE